LEEAGLNNDKNSAAIYYFTVSLKNSELSGLNNGEGFL